MKVKVTEDIFVDWEDGEHAPYASPEPQPAPRERQKFVVEENEDWDLPGDLGELIW